MDGLRQLILVLLGSIVIGVLWYLPMHFEMYFFIVIPAVAGLLIGALVNLSDSQQRMPGLTLVLFAIIGVLVMAGTFWSAQYTVYQNNTIDYIQSQYPYATHEDIIAGLEEAQMELYGTTGFMAFLTDVAETGFKVQRRSSSTATVNGMTAFLYWGVEILVALFVAISTVLKRKKPVSNLAVPDAEFMEKLKNS
ncbi:MAG: hypothetical protein CL607_05160 [Anaerolineaceae bacterium]|nr:hypothetical protein [Anaerolineaceae bacterium]